MAEHLLTFFYASLFIFIIVKIPFFSGPKVNSKWFAFVFILKVLSGILLGYLYRQYFNGGDTHTYFEQARQIYNFSKESFSDYLKILLAFDDFDLKKYYDQLVNWELEEYFYNDAHTVIRLNAFLCLFSFGNYNVHVIFFCFFSLFGLTCLYKCFLNLVAEKERLLFILLFFLPSVMFWNSGILKEGLLIFALGKFIYCLYKIIEQKKSYYFIPAVLSLCLLLIIKMYVLLILIPGIIAWLWSSRRNNEFVFFRFVASYSAFFLFFTLLKYVYPQLDFADIVYWKQVNSIKFAGYMQSKSIIFPPAIENSTWSLMENSPISFVKTLIQPMLGQAHNPFAVAAAIENIFILLIILITVLFSKIPPQKSLPLLFLFLFFVVFLYILIGFTTTTAGSLVRYKVPALPFLIFILLLFFNIEKFQRLFRSKPQH